MNRHLDAWSQAENEATVADYLDMLIKELSGEPYVKSQHRSRLRRLLSDRSDGAVERKHQNISAVLIRYGFPYINGYKPLGNAQAMLAQVLAAQIEARGIADTLRKAAESPAVPPPTGDWGKVELNPPPIPSEVRYDAEPYGLPRLPVKIDYLEREAAQRSIGLAGEEWAVQFEHARLWSLGAKKLADRIEHVSKERGDGLGYDILSYEADGRERLIEVKTTASGYMSPFFVSKRELDVSRERRDEYQLYRVFAFRSDPKLYRRPGPIDVGFALTPTQFRARPGM